MKVNKQQIIHFNILLQQLAIKDMKRDLILQATDGRTEHTKEMNYYELKDLIKHLQTRQCLNSYKEGDRKRKRILSICYQLPDELGFTKFDAKKNKTVVDMQRLDTFLCGKKSIFKKKLKYHTQAELSRVISQFENILKGYLNKY